MAKVAKPAADAKGRPKMEGKAGSPLGVGAPSDRARTITLRWQAILGGLMVAYVMSVALGIVLARLGQAGNLAVMPLVQFVALFTGGYVAGRWAGVSGFINGVSVAVAFIASWAIQNALQEAQLVQEYGPLALPRMNMGGIILGDLLNLSAAALGGWVTERRRGH